MPKQGSEESKEGVLRKGALASPAKPTKTSSTSSSSSSSASSPLRRLSRAVDENLTPTPTPTPGARRASSPGTPKTVLAFGGAHVKLEITPKVDKVYKLINKSTGTLGGNGTTGAIYGELTMVSMQKVINVLVKKCHLDSQSRFIDVGSGLGKPNFHAAQDPAVRVSVGIELEHIRWQLSMFNLKNALVEMRRGGRPEAGDNDNLKLFGGVNFLVGDIDAATSMDPFTHIYMYDLGFPPSLQQSIAAKFNGSVHARYLISYRPPTRVMEEYGYEVELVDQLATSMHGSGESHMCYIYRRTNAPLTEAQASARAHLQRITLPSRPGMPEQDALVYCDKAFAATVRLAAGPIDALRQHAAAVVQDQMDAARPKRERRPRAQSP